MIRTSICCLLMIFCFLTNAYSEENYKQDSINKEAMKQQVDNLVANTNIIIKEIDINLNVYHRIESEIMGRSAEGGNLIGYYEGDGLKKIAAEFYGETGNKKTSYYFTKGILIYVIEIEQLYDKPIYEGEVKVIKENTIKYYIQDKNIRLIIDSDDKIIRKNKSELNVIIKELLQDAKEFSLKLNAEYKKQEKAKENN